MLGWLDIHLFNQRRNRRRSQHANQADNQADNLQSNLPIVHLVNHHLGLRGKHIMRKLSITQQIFVDNLVDSQADNRLDNQPAGHLDNLQHNPLVLQLFNLFPIL